MREPEREDIDGMTYQVSPLPAKQALKLARKITAIVGKPLAQALGESAKDRALLMSRLAEVGERISDDDLMSVCNQLAEQTLIGNGDEMAQLHKCFDVHFAGRLDLMFQWLAFALKINFGPLVKSLGSGEEKAPASSPSTSPKK